MQHKNAFELYIVCNLKYLQMYSIFQIKKKKSALRNQGLYIISQGLSTAEGRKFLFLIVLKTFITEYLGKFLGKCYICVEFNGLNAFQ